MEGGTKPDRNIRTMSETVINSAWSWLAWDFSHIFLMTVIFSLTYVTLKAIQLYQRNRYLIKVLKPFPGPPTHWLYGHASMLNTEEEYLNAIAWKEKYPHCHPLWLGNLLACLCINHPEYAKAVYSRDDPKALETYKFLIPWIGRGLLILNGPKWQKHRKLLTPGFHYSILKPYVTIMTESTKEMLDIWEKLVLKDATTSLEMFEHVSLMTLDSIMKCAFSYHSNCQTNRENSYIHTVFDLTYLYYNRLKTPWLHSDFIYKFTPQGRQFNKACRLAQLHTEKIIKERKESLKNEQELEKILKKRHLDFLDILLCAKDENGHSLPDEDIRAEVDTFMFEGHDTTASGISWLLYCMAQNPEHQERCREEIKDVLRQQEDIQWDDLAKMTYSTMCIKESLRLYPPVPLVARKLNSPVTFVDGRTLPKGFLIGLSIFELHRNPEVWDNPEVFNPLRFSTEQSHHRHPYAFLPFAAGPRNCIGQQFAMIEMKIALALTLLRFELLPDPSKPPIPISQIVTRSKDGIYLKLKPIH